MAKRPNQKPQNFKPIIKNPIRLSKSIMSAWQQTVAEHCHFPKGTKITETPIEKLVILAINYDTEQIKQVWKAFTQERKEISSKMLTPKGMAQTYLLGFHLGNVARLSFLIKQSMRFNALVDTVNKYKNVELYDLGCGSGAMSIGYGQFFKQNMKRSFRFMVKLVDTSSPLLDIAETGLSGLGLKDLQVKKFKGGLESLDLGLNKQSKDALGIYTLGYVWNELLTNKKAKQKIDQLFDHLILENKEAIVTILEPANEAQSRDAMMLHDEMIERGYTVLYPCSHSKHCPLLETEKDWCYSEMSWEKPEPQKKVDRILGIDRQTMAVSGYTFATPALVKKGLLVNEESQVIVGRPTEKLKNRIQVQYLVCDKDGITKEVAENQDNLLPKGYKLFQDRD